MKTKRGIYYDLRESEYVFKYGSLTFYFSSNLYREKFSERIDYYLKNETMKLNNKYQCKLEGNEMFALNLYKNIEKRGFRVYYYDYELNNNYSVLTTIRK